MKETKDYSRKSGLEIKLEEANHFKMHREKLEKDGKWNLSDQYAKYRHLAPPRFEWLIDLGVLEKRQRGKYSVTPLAKRISEEALSMDSIFEDEAFYQLGKIYLNTSDEPTSEELKTALVKCYNKFSAAGYLAVDLSLLGSLVAYQLLTLQKITKLSAVENMIKNIHKSIPGCVEYHVDLHGVPRLVKIATNKINT